MCIFCEIINGNIPSKKVFENDEVIAILDLSQTTKGHTLVIPKKHYNNYLEMPKEDFASLMGNVSEVSNIVVSKLNAKGANLLVNANEVAGQTVMHTHVHIIPRYDAEDTISINFTENKLNLDEVLAEISK